MAQIETSRGMMDEADLVASEGCDNDERATVFWQEWRASDGEIVKRCVQVEMKQAGVASGQIGDFG